MHSGLELKICVNTYKLFFVNDTEDYFKRCNTRLSEKKLEILKNKRKNKFIKWFSKINNISEEEGKLSLNFSEKKETNIVTVNEKTLDTKDNNISISNNDIMVSNSNKSSETMK